MLEVPVTITYRLEADNRIIEREEGIQPLELDERLIRMLDEAARRAGIPREKIVADLITETFAERLARDETKKAQLERLKQQHDCNILVEVRVDGEIHWPEARASN